MANQSLAKVPVIDPEFAAAYADAGKLPGSTKPPAVSTDLGEEDPLLALKRIAETNMRTARKSSDCEDGFDRVENDVSNVCKTLFDFVTR